MTASCDLIGSSGWQRGVEQLGDAIVTGRVEP